MLPEGWKEVLLKECISIKHGFAFESKFFSDSGKFAVLTPGNFYEEGGFRENKEKTRYYTADFDNEYILAKGNLIIAMTEQKAGLLGSSAFVPADGMYLHNQRLGLVQINDNLSIALEFLYLLYNSKPIRDIIEKTASGTKVKHTSPEKLLNILVALPPLAEQKKIAEILSTWDEAISVVDKQLENCRLQKKALMQQLLTGKKRLPGFSGEWKAKRLSSFCKRITERNNGHCSLVATISAQYGLIRQEEFFNKSVASETLDNYFLLRKGDFAYNKSYSLGYPMGAIKRLNRYQEAVVTSLYICFRLDETKADSDYFEFFFDSGLLDKPLTQIAAEGGRAHGLLNVRPDDFMGIQILFPPLEEQKAIASVLSTSARQIEMLEQKLNALQEEKKSLMQQLLTGKKHVAVEE